MTRAFLMSIEAAASLLLVVAAAQLSASFSFPQGSAADFYLCSDAAVLLAKSGALSGDAAQGASAELSELSGMCISIESAGAQASGCPGRLAMQSVHAFTLVAHAGGTVSQSIVSCWRRK